MTTPDRMQPASSFDKVLQDVEELESRYGKACERLDSAGNPITRAISRVNVALCVADLRTTRQLLVVELEGEQIADGAVPMVED